MRALFCLLLVVGLSTAAIFRNPFPSNNDRADRTAEDYDNYDQVNCEDGMYYSEESGECEYCSECDQAGMYIRSACSPTKNTQCGWCASRQIVKNVDFERKCKNFGKQDENSIVFDEETEFEEIQPIKPMNGKIIEVLDEEDSNEESGKKENEIVNDKEFEGKKIKESQELTSEEIDEEIHAKIIDESDIAKSEQTQTDNEDRIADRKPLTFLNPAKRPLIIMNPVSEFYEEEEDDELPPLPVDNLSPEELEDEDESEKQAYIWKDELKNKIEKIMLQRQAELHAGKVVTIEDESEEGSVLEVKAPKSFDLDGEEAQELIRASKKMLPLKIIVTGNTGLLKDMPPIADGDSEEDDSYSSESKENSSSEEDSEEITALEVSQEELNERTTRRMIRICIMSITFVIMCWIFLSYREKRRRRIFVIPSLDTFTPEQEHMINRCNCNLEKLEGGHCYENKMAYV